MYVGLVTAQLQKQKNVITLQKNMISTIKDPRGIDMDRIIIWGTFVLIVVVGFNFVAS